MDGVADQMDDLALSPEEDAKADAEFLAAFNETRGVTAHVEGPTDTNNVEADAELAGDTKESGEAESTAQADADAQAAAEAAQVEAAAKAQAEAEAPVTLTRAEVEQMKAAAARVEQLQAELRKTNDSMAGRMGSLKQSIDALKEKAQGGSRIAIGQLKRLEGEYPELAKLLTEDLTEQFGAQAAAEPAKAEPAHGDIEVEDDASGVAPGANEPANAQADPFNDPRVQETLRAKDMAVVDAAHSDWRTLAMTPDFGYWKATLPAPAQALLDTSWDASVLVPAFNDFKKFQQKRVAANTASEQRDKRLQNGIPATTGTPTGAHVVDDDAAFMAGFNSVRKGA